jgi:hypothetical protein
VICGIGSIGISGDGNAVDGYTEAEPQPDKQALSISLTP